MPIDPADPDRSVREGSVQIGGGRERVRSVLGGVPVVLIPSASHNPSALRQRFGKRFETGYDLRFGCGTDQVSLEQACAEAHQVSMRVDQAGHDGPPVRVEALGIGVGREHVGVGAHG